MRFVGECASILVLSIHKKKKKATAKWLVCPTKPNISSTQHQVRSPKNCFTLSIFFFFFLLCPCARGIALPSKCYASWETTASILFCPLKSLLAVEPIQCQGGIQNSVFVTATAHWIFENCAFVELFIFHVLDFKIFCRCDLSQSMFFFCFSRSCFFFFLFSGILSIGWWLVWQVLVADSPEEHRFISEKEREYVVLSRTQVAAGKVSCYMDSAVMRWKAHAWQWLWSNDDCVLQSSISLLLNDVCSLFLPSGFSSQRIRFDRQPHN